jgi:hypothetical protein
MKDTTDKPERPAPKADALEVRTYRGMAYVTVTQDVAQVVIEAAQQKKEKVGT